MERIALNKDVYDSWILLCTKFGDCNETSNLDAYEMHHMLHEMRLGDKEGEPPREFITRWGVTLQQYGLCMATCGVNVARKKAIRPYTELVEKVIAQWVRAQVQGIERDSNKARKLGLKSLAEPTQGAVKVNNPTPLSQSLAGNENRSAADFEVADASPSTSTCLLLTLLHCLVSTQPECTSALETSASAYEPRFVFRQLELMLELRAQVPVVSGWLADHDEAWEWLYEWLRLKSLHPSLGGHLPLLKREPGKLGQLGQALGVPYQEEQRRYLVEGAGYAPVNGMYVSTTVIHDDCLTYVCRKGDMEYTLYRCCMTSKARRWYISYARGKLGTRSDEDFYYVKPGVDEEAPPADGWQSWSGNVKVNEPVPIVSLYSSTVAELDDDGIQAAGEEVSGFGVSVVSASETALESEEESNESDDEIVDSPRSRVPTRATGQ